MNRIKELRKQQNMTQKELANYLQIADSTLSYWEQGKYEPDIDALKHLSKFFKVPIDYLLGSELSEWSGISDNGDSIVKEDHIFYNNIINSGSTNRNEFTGLTNEEINKLAEYAEFLKSQRNKNNYK